MKARLHLKLLENAVFPVPIKETCLDVELVTPLKEGDSFYTANLLGYEWEGRIDRVHHYMSDLAPPDGKSFGHLPMFWITIQPVYKPKA